jgi:uncharacterized membrane protein
MGWPYAVSWTLRWLWLALGTASLLAAAVLACRPALLERADAFFSRSSRARAGLGAFFAVGAVLCAAAFKAAQYASFQTMGDTAAAVNMVWNFAHGHGLVDSLHAGESGLAFHFALILTLLAPVLRVWNSALVFPLAQGLAVGSAPFAVYLYARRVQRGWALPALTGLLAFSSPLLHMSLYSMTDGSVFALPLFLWMALAWERESVIAAALLTALYLTTREQAVFLFFGAPLYWFVKRKSRRADVAPALAVMAAAAVAFAAEMAVIARARGPNPHLIHFWATYSALGGSPRELMTNALHRPWLFPLAAVYPWSKALLVARTFLGAGAVSLASGPALLPLLTIWAPQQLADSTALFHQLREHYAAFVAGPLLWTAALGIAELLGPRRRIRAPFLAAWLLAVAGVNFLLCETSLLPAGTFPAAWNKAVPDALEHIPPGAKVWTDEYLSPQIATRRYARILPLGESVVFETALFLPDRVLMSLHWAARADPAYRDRILGFLRGRGFVPIFREEDLVVWADPRRPDVDDGRVELVRLPP